jgi:hypothetical protein|tara:strand:+ start:901 stop:1062 length:162 start_codon:yes stop_codon:yes gene_type:complete
MNALAKLSDDAEKTVVGPEMPIRVIKREIELWFKYWENTKRYIERGYANYRGK